MATITVHQSSRGRVPSCYVGKTFEVRRIQTVGDAAPTVRGGMATWDKWEGSMKNGKRVTFTRFSAFPNELIVHREGCFSGTWLFNYEIDE